MTCNKLLIDPEVANTSGVYVIANLESGRVYIGSSYKVKNRLSNHIWNLRRNSHANPHLQSSWNKRGENAFFFSILEYAEVQDLEEVEQRYFEEHSRHCYNARIVVASNSGLRHSSEAKRLIGENSRRSWQKSDYRERIAQAQLGTYERTPEYRERMRNLKTGNRASEATRKKMRDVKRKALPPRTLEHSVKVAATKAKSYIVTTPDGIEITVVNLREFCRGRELQQSHMGKVANGRQKNHMGWLCRHA